MANPAMHGRRRHDLATSNPLSIYYGALPRSSEMRTSSARPARDGLGVAEEPPIPRECDGLDDDNPALPDADTFPGTVPAVVVTDDDPDPPADKEELALRDMAEPADEGRSVAVARADGRSCGSSVGIGDMLT